MAQAGAAGRNYMLPQDNAVRRDVSRTIVPSVKSERRIQSPAGTAAQAQRIRVAHTNQMMTRLMIGLVTVLLFVYIGRMASISASAKEISRIRQEITQLREEQQYLEVKLAARQDLDRVRDEAVGRLGMKYPEAGQVQIVSLGGYTVNVNPQTALDHAAP